MPSIQYVVVVPHSRESPTPFQGFNALIANEPFIRLLRCLAVLPFEPQEVGMTPDQVVSFRMSGASKSALMIGVEYLKKLGPPPGDLVVYLCLPAQVSEVCEVHTDGATRILVTTEDVDGAVHLPSFEAAHPLLLDDDLARRFGIHEQRKIVEVGHASRGAGVTRAAEWLIESLGMRFSGVDLIRAKNADIDYATAILGAAELSADKLGVESASGVGVLLFAPAIAAQLYNFDQNFWNQINRRLKKVDRDYLRNGLIRNPHYSGYVIKADRKPEDWNPYKDPMTGSIVATRQLEIALSNAAVGCLASAESLVPIRLPNAVNLKGRLLKEIEVLMGRTDSAGLKKLQKRFTELESELRDAIDDRLWEFVSQRSTSCVICSDAPIEWIYSGGLPLMIAKDVSRISMTPGNMLLHQSTFSPRFAIPLSELQDVLIIRSFLEADPIRNCLADALGKLGLSKLRIRIVDVDSVEEAKGALNAYSGSIVIFDCHGGHGGVEDHAWLQIGRERLDTWSLAHSARVPPIVLLSACSTFALAGSHASVANGLIRSGAMTVLGTFLPVDANLSAVMVARLLLRIEGYLPAMREIGLDSISWQTVISSFLRMSFATDVLMFLAENGMVDSDTYTTLAYEANMRINSFDEEWYGALVRSVAANNRCSAEELLEKIRREQPLVETMFYCQVGKPDNLGVLLQS